MANNPESVGAHLRGEVLPALEGTRDTFTDRLSKILFTEGFERTPNPSFGQLIDRVVNSTPESDPQNFVIRQRSIDYVRFLEANRGLDPEKWQEDLGRLMPEVADLSPEDTIVMFAAGMKAVARDGLTASFERASLMGKMGEEGGLYSPDIQAAMSEVYTQQERRNATVDFGTQTRNETRRRIHQYAILRFTEKSRSSWGAVREYLLNSSGTRAHDFSGDLLEAMQKIGEVSAERNKALGAEDAAGAVLRLGLEGIQPETLIQSYRMGVRLIVEVNGQLQEKTVFFGTKEAYDFETGNMGRRILGGDERLLDEHAAAVQRLYPELRRDGIYGPLTAEQQERHEKYKIHPVYFSDQTYVADNGVQINPGEPIFSFRLRQTDKRKLLVDPTRRSMLTTDYEQAAHLRGGEPAVPQRLNPGEKVRTMQYTDFKHDAALEWVTHYLRDLGIDPKSIVAADILYPGMRHHGLGEKPKKYGLFQDIGPMASKEVQVVAEDGTEIVLDQHPHFIMIPPEERSDELLINLFAVRGGSFWGLAEGIKSAGMEMARENPALVGGGELVDQGATYAQLAFSYLRYYQIGELYSQVAGMNYYPGVGGRKYSNWAIYRAMQDKHGYRYKRYADDGVTVLNDEPRTVIDINGQSVRIGKHKLGWIRWSADADQKDWQKAIHEYVFFSRRRFRMDNEDRNQAMRIVETARAGMSLVPGDLPRRRVEVERRLGDISGLLLKENIKGLIQDEYSNMIEKRTRRESRELARLPLWALQKMEGASYKPYLASVGMREDLDPIEYEGILGLEAAIDRESIDKFDWQRTDLMKQAKYEMTSERAYKTSGVKLRQAMVQAKDPNVMALFGFGMQPMDAQDLQFKIIGGLMGFLSQGLQIDKKMTEEFGKQVAESLAEYGSSIPDRTAFGSRRLVQDLVRMTEDMVDESAFFAAIELRQRKQLSVGEDDTIVRRTIEEGSSPGVGSVQIKLQYAGNRDAAGDRVDTDWADRIAAPFLRKIGLRVVHPNDGFDDSVSDVGLIDPSKFNADEIVNLPYVVSGDGRWLDRPVSTFVPTREDWEWKTASADGETDYLVDAGPVLRDVFGHHKLGLLARKATTLMFINNMLQDATVITKFDQIGITEAVRDEFSRQLAAYQEQEQRVLNQLGIALGQQPPAPQQNP